MHCCLDVMYYRSFELKDGDSIFQTNAWWYTDSSVNGDTSLAKCSTVEMGGGGEVSVY